MPIKMRAKVKVLSLVDHRPGWQAETVTFIPVSRSDRYPDDGSDENNTYAKFSPSGEFKLTIANPALLDQHKVGEEYYVDFTPVVANAAADAAALGRHDGAAAASDLPTAGG